jgi:hypothetical protein
MGKRKENLEVFKQVWDNIPKNFQAETEFILNLVALK